MFELVGFAYISGVRDSQKLYCFRFPKFTRFHNFNLCFRNTLWKDDCFWTQENNPEIIKVSEFKKIISFFVVDIGTILAKFHSCFLIDIGLISKISRVLLSDSSSFFGSCHFQHWQPFGSPYFLLCKNNIFRVNLEFLVFREVFLWYIRVQGSIFAVCFWSSKNVPTSIGICPETLISHFGTIKAQRTPFGKD